jgi:GH15 family glucan-1,4-alpha-glucosidase
MPREIVLGNGRLTVAIDNKLNIRDFSYPEEGLENHAKGHPFRIAVWTDGAFSWIGDEWDVNSRYLPDTLVSKCSAINQKLKIELKINDTVYSFLDLFLRRILVTNLSEKTAKSESFFLTYRYSGYSIIKTNYRHHKKGYQKNYATGK